MKSLPFLFLLLWLSPPGKELPNLFQSYEASQKTVALHLQRKASCKKKKENFRLERTRYFKIIPPQYDIQFDTIPVFDSSKFTKEMSALYQVSQELILVKKGGFKWIKEKQIINFCEQEKQFKDLSKKQWILKYQKELDEYTSINKLTVRIAPNHRPPDENAKEDWEAISARNKLAAAQAKAGRSQQIIKREMIKRPGYLEEISLADLEKSDLKETELLVLSKGKWTITEAGRVAQKCEAQLKNQQICLYRLGYDTSLDGVASLKHRVAKHQFRQDHNLLKASEEEYLQALGW